MKSFINPQNRKLTLPHASGNDSDGEFSGSDADGGFETETSSYLLSPTMNIIAAVIASSTDVVVPLSYASAGCLGRFRNSLSYFWRRFGQYNNENFGENPIVLPNICNERHFDC
ncbi:hypothetical protein F0562_023822 [Nyssa sinensis]|uniref:Uncharacterized protein n=1 Tax=Nyssa sinensis TaxID=561372 RepID=A0A5J5BIT6_9ASTE|nr:hypothetical protein F0562_023822 [Nyssa sinensis]